MVIASGSTISQYTALDGAFVAVAALMGIIGSCADYLSSADSGLSLWDIRSERAAPGELLAGVVTILIGIAVMVVAALVTLIASGRPGGVSEVFGQVLTLVGHAVFIMLPARRAGRLTGTLPISPVRASRCVRRPLPSRSAVA